MLDDKKCMELYGKSAEQMENYFMNTTHLSIQQVADLVRLLRK